MKMNSMKPMCHLILAALAVSCTTGPQPHDTSIAGHQRAASEHERAAQNLEAACPSAPAAPCWTSRDKAAIAAHHEAALRHRAASAALVAAEKQACTGIPEADVETSPFEHRADIASVESLIGRELTGKLVAERQVGALVTFRAIPGLTAEWLQRLVDCHLARNAALGHDVPEMPDCPLVPRGVEARVRSTGNGFAVEIRSNNRDIASEILARARRLAPVSPRRP